MALDRMQKNKYKNNISHENRTSQAHAYTLSSEGGARNFAQIMTPGVQTRRITPPGGPGQPRPPRGKIFMEAIPESPHEIFMRMKNMSENMRQFPQGKMAFMRISRRGRPFMRPIWSPETGYFAIIGLRATP